MGDKLTIRELVDKLNEATIEYDKGTPIMTDKEWDDLYFELKEREKSEGIVYPDSPTQIICFASISKLKKVTHNHPMLSLAKTKSINEVKNFIGDRQCLLMFKLDGLTLSLRYLGGELVSAETRGNGAEGEDVLHNAMVIPSIPKIIPTTKEVIVDGELICDNKTFQEKFANKYKNPRNYAAGAIRRLDAMENKNSGLTFVAWDWINGKYDTLSDNLDQLALWGFKTVPSLYYPAPDHFWTGDQKTPTLEEQIEGVKKYSTYPIDGVVIKYNDVKYYQSLGATAHHFNGGLAYKFYDEEYETRLRYIDYDVSRNGILTPVAVFEPIDIDGSMVERASLHNMSIMEEVLGRTPYVGEPVWVFKANMIIPQISKAIKKDYGDIVANGGVTTGLGGDYGVLCPICHGETCIKESETGVKILYCPNPTCEGKLAQRIDYYCSKKGLDIKGLSRATIEKLIDWGWLSSISDIYELDKHIVEWQQKPGFGTKSVLNIITSISNSMIQVQLVDFISALGIPLVGKTVAKEICKYYHTWDDFMDAIGGDWSVFDGFGPEISRSINEFDYEEANEIVKKIHICPVETVVANNNNISGKTFVVTGKLNSFKNRDKLKADIESFGGKVVSAVSAKTDYLINNDINSTSSKNVQAKKQGIPIITEADYLKMKA